MESDPTIASYIGYGIICLFLLAATVGVMRSAMFFSWLAILPFVRDKSAPASALEAEPPQDDTETLSMHADVELTDRIHRDDSPSIDHDR